MTDRRTYIIDVLTGHPAFDGESGAYIRRIAGSLLHNEDVPGITTKYDHWMTTGQKAALQRILEASTEVK